MIWIIGNQGMLGKELAEQCGKRAIQMCGSDREVSMLDVAALRAFAANKSSTIEWIINCAAYTAVDKAEDDQDTCRALNVDGPRNIGRIATEIGANVIHISTDYVFSGESQKPYVENDPVSPRSVYGATKAEGEAALQAACPQSIILRTAWLYGKHGPNFVKTMLRLMNERDSIGVVADQYGSPTWARDLVGVIVSVINSPNPSYGIYHYTNEGVTNWHEFACQIYAEGRALGIIQHECAVRPLTTAEYPAKAKRPQYSVLSKAKIKKAFKVSIPVWQNSLRSYLEEQRSEEKK